MAKKKAENTEDVFDPTKFNSGEEDVIEPTTEEVVDELDEDLISLDLDDEEEIEDEEDDELEDEESEDDEEDEELDDLFEEEDEELETEEDEENDEVSEGEDWSEVSKELGIEATTKEDLVSKMKQALLEVSSLKERLEEVSQTGSEADVIISKLNNLLTLPPDELVKKNLLASGLTEEEATAELEDIIDSGDLDREYRSVKRDIKLQARNVEINRDKINADKQSKIEAERNVFYKGVEDALLSTDTFMGIKIGRDEKEGKKIKSKAFADYSNGDVFNEIISSEKNVAQIVLFWKLKDKIVSALSSNGQNAGRRTVIEKLGNADKITSTSRKIREATKPGEFNPKSFMGLE